MKPKLFDLILLYQSTTDNYHKNLVYNQIYKKLHTKIGSFAKNYSIRYGMDKEELAQEACIVLLDCLNNFDTNGHFNTYFSKSLMNNFNGLMKKHLIRITREVKDQQNQLNFLEDIKQSDELENVNIKIDVSNALTVIENEENILLLKDKFINNKTYQELAISRGESPQLLCYRCNRLINKIRTEMDKQNGKTDTNRRKK